LVVLDHERWLDTLKGTVKNYSKRPARDVTVVVKFFDRKKKALGTQRVNVGDLRSGDSSSWSLPIAEKNRSATQYTFETHAIW
jgi:RIO-like serine/threonine protein kinase